MPTIIDSLVVSLGLDSKDLDAKSGSAGKKLKEVEGQSAKTEGGVRKIGVASKEAAVGVGGLTRTLGSFLALIAGTMAIKAFASDFIDANAALLRLSQNLGLGVSTISAWGKASEELGGSAAGLQGTLDMLSMSQTELRLTGQSSLIPYFSALGVSLADVNGKARPVDAILLDLADRFSRMDRTTANNMGRMMGIDQGTMNLLLQGRKELELTIKRQKESTAVTQKQAEAAQKLQTQIVETKQKFTALGNALMLEAAPALERLADLFLRLGNWVLDNEELVTDFLKVMAVGLGAIALITAPINLAVVAVLALAAGIALLWQDYQVWKRGGTSFIDWAKWEPEIRMATKAITLLGDAIARVIGLKSQPANNHAPGSGYTQLKDNAPAGWASPGGGEPGGAATGEQIKKYFEGQGWSSAQAAGIAANFMRESVGRTKAPGDGGHAYGLGQWHSDRQANFAKFAGHSIKSSTLPEQLAFAQYELTHGEKRAGDALRGATNAGQAGAIVSRMYERPADADGEARLRSSLALALAGVGGATGAIAAASPTPAGSGVSSSDSSVTNHIGEIKVYTAATDANGIARGMNFLFTSQANAGLN